MKGLIVYFSNTGRTRKVAEAIKALTGFKMIKPHTTSSS